MTKDGDRIAREVLDLNRNGWKLYEIAEQYGFTKQRASQLRIRALVLERRPETGIWYELSLAPVMRLLLGAAVERQRLLWNFAGVKISYEFLASAKNVSGNYKLG